MSPEQPFQLQAQLADVAATNGPTALNRQSLVEICLTQARISDGEALTAAWERRAKNLITRNEEGPGYIGDGFMDQVTLALATGKGLGGKEMHPHVRLIIEGLPPEYVRTSLLPAQPSGHAMRPTSVLTTNQYRA